MAASAAQVCFHLAFTHLQSLTGAFLRPALENALVKMPGTAPVLLRVSSRVALQCAETWFASFTSC